MPFNQFSQFLNNCNKHYKNFPEIIAQKSAKLTIGLNLVFNSINEKLQNKLYEWFNKNNILEILYLNETLVSKWGKGILFLLPSKNNITLHYVKNLYNGRVAKVNEQEQIAEIWNQSNQGDLLNFQKIIITSKKIKIINYTSQKSRIGSTEVTPDDELIPLNEYEFDTPLGIFPLVEIQNLPYNNMFGSTLLNFRPDWLPVMESIKTYQNAYRISQVELQANRTRYFGEIDTKKLKELKENNNYAGEDIIGDAWINTTTNSMYSKSTSDNNIQVVAGQPNLKTYSDWLTFIEEQIMNGAGYTPPKIQKTNEIYQNKTSSLFADKLDKETTDYKQSLRKPKLYKIFDYVLKFYGFEPYDKNGQRIYSFDFVNLAITDTTTKIQNNKELLELGIISPSEMRSDVFNIPINLAKEQMKEINKENEEYIQKELGNRFKKERYPNQNFKIDKDEDLASKVKREKEQ